MAIENVTNDYVISYDNLFSDYSNHFLHAFKNAVDVDLYNGTRLNVKIHERKPTKKINPIIRQATPEDAEEIVYIYKDVYEGTYPYKEMEDVQEVRRMIQSPDVEWLVFTTTPDEIVGCFTFVLNFEDKMGYLRGLNLKKKYLGKIDVFKAAIGSFLAMYHTYKDRIFRWYGESRTAHTKSQYALGAGGFKPIAFYPNKDVFYNKIESDILLICYDEKALNGLRCKKTPKILPEAQNGFLYSDRRYKLGKCEIVDPKLNLDYKTIEKIRGNISREASRDKYGYTDVKYTVKSTGSYIKFIYTPRVQNFEKTKYRVKSLEELFVLAQEFKKCAEELCVRYYEIYLSAYKPEHQKIFRKIGLTPRGYIPSWKYNGKKEYFEDYVLFNNYEGKIDENIQLLDEGQELLRCLNFTV